MADAQTGSTEGQLPEPFPGFADASIPDVEKAIAAAPDDQRESLKAQIRAVESSKDAPRKGVIDATEPAAPPAPAAADPDDENPPPVPDEDDARPSLLEVAEERANNERVRVVDTTPKED